MLIESIILTSKEAKLLFTVARYRKTEAEQQFLLKQWCVMWRKISKYFIFIALQKHPIRLLLVHDR